MIRREEKARLPLALAAPLLAAALVRPAGLDPEQPLLFLPADTWGLLLVAAAAPAATVLATRALVEKSDRNQTLVRGGLALLAGLVAVSIGAIALADALLYREGGARIVLAASLAALAIVAGALAVKPSRALAGALGGELVVVLLLRTFMSGAATPVEHVKQAMVVAPGWGQTSLASIATRNLFPIRVEDLDLWDASLRKAIDEGELDRYADDARVVHGWILFLRARGTTGEKHVEILRQAAREQRAFAASPASSLEPFTAGGVISLRLLFDTKDLPADRDLRQRLFLAWSSLEIFAVAVDDPMSEVESIDVLRALFHQYGLPRTHPLYLATLSIERRRLVLDGDGAAFAARFEALAKEPWPPELAADFAEDAKFVRDHPEEGYVPVMTLLRARSHAGNGKMDEAEKTYRELLTKWPASPLAPIARLEMAKIPKAGS